MSQSDLARRLRMSTAHVSHIEGGTRIPNIELMQKIAIALGTSVSVLVGESEVGVGGMDSPPSGLKCSFFRYIGRLSWSPLDTSLALERSLSQGSGLPFLQRETEVREGFCVELMIDEYDDLRPISLERGDIALFSRVKSATMGSLVCLLTSGTEAAVAGMGQLEKLSATRVTLSRSIGHKDETFHVHDRRQLAGIFEFEGKFVLTDFQKRKLGLV